MTNNYRLLTSDLWLPTPPLTQLSNILPEAVFRVEAELLFEAIDISFYGGDFDARQVGDLLVTHAELNIGTELDVVAGELHTQVFYLLEELWMYMLKMKEEGF